MTTTLRPDGVLFNDGSLQTSAASSPPLMGTGQWGVAYKANPGDVDWAIQQPIGSGTSQYHAITPYVLWQSKGLDVGNRYTYPVNLNGSRAVGVTYTNTTTTPLYVCVTSLTTGNFAGVTIAVDGVVASNREGDMDGGGANISAWAIVPVGSNYVVNSSISEGSGFSNWVEIGER